MPGKYARPRSRDAATRLFAGGDPSEQRAVYVGSPRCRPNGEHLLFACGIDI